MAEEDVGKLFETVNEGANAAQLLEAAEASELRAIRKIASAIKEIVNSGQILEPQFAVQKWLEVVAQGQMIANLDRKRREGERAAKRLSELGHNLHTPH